MSINFPNAPTAGQVFTSEGRSFVWTGSVWILQPQSFPWASQAEALAGTATNRVMSPDTTRQRIDAIAEPGADHPFSGTPTNVLAQRAVDTAYQNTLGRPMCIAVWGATAVALDIGASEAALSRFHRTVNVAAGAPACLFSVIPRDWWYRLTINAGAAISGWTEYR